MKVLITGAGGQLGREFAENSSVRCSTGEWEFIPLSHGELDITDKAAAEQAMREYMPHAVINCSAMTNVDLCEKEPEKALKINSEGAKTLCLAAAGINADFVQLSTDFVFDGLSDKPYTESSPCNPLNVYGRSKLISEEYVRSITPRHFIVRTAWLYGRYGRNFVTSILANAAKGPLRVVNDQTGCPSCTEEVMKYILLLIKSGKYGTYHVSGKGICTKYEFAKHILSHAGTAAEVSPCLTSDFPSAAARPPYSVLDSSLAEQTTGYVSPDWKKVYDDYYGKRKEI